MFFRGQKYKNDCIKIIMRVSGVEEKNALKFFTSIKNLNEYSFNYKVGHPEEDVISAYITVFNEMYHIYNAMLAGHRHPTKLGKTGELTLLSLVVMAYHAGKKIPKDPALMKHLPKQFNDRFADFCKVQLPTVSSGLVPIKVWMEELPQSETLGIAF